jgi:hypothetical protein
LSDLGKYVKFFKKIIHDIMVKCAKQNIFVVELRHIPGSVFDDNRQPVSLADELKIFKEV